MTKETNTEIAELKAKLEIYEKWQNEDSKFSSQYSSFSTTQSADDEIDLKELWNVIWQGKWEIIAISFVFTLASVFYALSLPNIYKSEALLMPNSQESKGGGMGGLAGQFGGLASLAGINLGGGGTDKTGYALEVLKSREFLYKFIEDNNLKVAIMATKGWIRESNRLTYNQDVYDINTNKWLRKANAPFKSEPSLQETYEKFLVENIEVFRDEESGMVSIAVRHYSPYIAQKLVEKLILAINKRLKQHDMREAQKSIRYFEEELQTTTLTGTQTMFYKLIEQQQQTLMLTKVRDDYVFKVIDSAFVPERKSAPSRALICILGLILGAILGMLVSLIRYYGRKR